MTPRARAALWMGGAIASFSLMAVATREVSGAFDTFEIMLYRGAIGVVLVTASLAATGKLALARPRRMGGWGARSLVCADGELGVVPSPRRSHRLASGGAVRCVCVHRRAGRPTL